MNLRARIAKEIAMFRVGLRDEGLLAQVLWAVATLARAITGVPVRALSQVTPQLHLGGQYRQGGWPRLAARGITAIVNMRAECNGDRADGASARYLHLPIPDGEAPTLRQLRQGTAFIAAEIARGGAVYVHCHSGVGRAATMVAAYLTSTGLAPGEAWGRIRKVRSFVHPTSVQLAQVERFASVARTWDE